jgi:hypothetical protein
MQKLIVHPIVGEFVWDFEGSHGVFRFSIEFPLGTLGTFEIPHKYSHTTGLISFHFKVGHQKGFGVVTSTLRSPFRKEEVDIRFPLLVA